MKKIQVMINGEWKELIEAVTFRVKPYKTISSFGLNGYWNINDIQDIRLVDVANEGTECNHDHATCPGDIKTIKCAYCGESLYQKPKKIEKLDYDTHYVLHDLVVKFNQIIDQLNKE